MKSFDELYRRAGTGTGTGAGPGTAVGATTRPRRLAVAAAADEDVLRAVADAEERGIAEATLVGKSSEIRRLAESIDYAPPADRIVHADSPEAAAERAVRMAAGSDPDGRSAEVLMKGLVDTSVLMHAALNGEWGLRTPGLMSHVALFEIPDYPRMLLLSDAAMTIAPSLEQKVEIILNAVDVAHGIGIANPKVAVLCAKEKVSPKMPATEDAEKLAALNRDGKISGCTVGGPFALDNAVSPEAARHKGVTHPGAGEADILLAPDIEAGNILYKALVFLAGARNAGIIVGARSPIVLTSRADSRETKLNSIALAVLAQVADNVNT